jgi:hypothetical protein
VCGIIPIDELDRSDLRRPPACRPPSFLPRGKGPKTVGRYYVKRVCPVGLDRKSGGLGLSAETPDAKILKLGKRGRLGHVA